MLKGTRILYGAEAHQYKDLLEDFRDILIKEGFQEVVVPVIWEAETFENKITGETKEQMWTFVNKGGKKCCLIPEVTGIIQELYEKQWSKVLTKPVKVFYTANCFRYENPQLGRQRQFTQFGCEVLGNITDKIREDVKDLLKKIFTTYRVYANFNPSVKRGLGYYIKDGFEMESCFLGAERQIAGGGEYKDGIGWAIGVERFLLAVNKSKQW